MRLGEGSRYHAANRQRHYEIDLFLSTSDYQLSAECPNSARNPSDAECCRFGVGLVLLPKLRSRPFSPSPSKLQLLLTYWKPLNPTANLRILGQVRTKTCPVRWSEVRKSTPWLARVLSRRSHDPRPKVGSAGSCLRQVGSRQQMEIMHV